MQIILASDNLHKLAEISAVLPDALALIPQSNLEISTPEESGLTFVENAILKARHASTLSGLPAIADDSGLEVDFLDGSPGIYSSRYAGLMATDADNNKKLLAALAGVPVNDRRAKFQSVIVMLRHAKDPTPIIARGTWHGSILEQVSGSGGFGYDPLFFIADLGKSAAQLSAEEKNKLSHRAIALLDLQAQMDLKIDS